MRSWTEGCYRKQKRIGRGTVGSALMLSSHYRVSFSPHTSEAYTGPGSFVWRVYSEQRCAYDRRQGRVRTLVLSPCQRNCLFFQIRWIAGRSQRSLCACPIFQSFDRLLRILLRTQSSRIRRNRSESACHYNTPGHQPLHVSSRCPSESKHSSC